MDSGSSVITVTTKNGAGNRGVFIVKFRRIHLVVQRNAHSFSR